MLLLFLAVRTRSLTSDSRRWSCHFLSSSMDAFAPFTVFKAYQAAPNEWSAIWAAATACPTARATATWIEFERSFATAIAPTEAFLASPTEALPWVHSFAMVSAVISRLSIGFP